MNTTWMLTTIAMVGVLASPGIGQCQRQKLLASDGQPSDHFGQAVAISGDWAAVGAPYTDDVAAQSGSVYIFQRLGSGWVQSQKVKASDASFGAVFGSAVAMFGSVLLVGAPQDSPQGLSYAGSAYVFNLVGSTWVESGKLMSGDPDGDDGFGEPVAMSGDRMLIGARFDSAHGPDSGAAYVFDLVGTSWLQTAKLIGSDVGFNDGVGLSIGLAGDQAILGAPTHDVPGASGTGAAYLFENGAGGWLESQRLLASDGVAKDFFGVSVALLPAHAVVGAASSHHFATAGGALYGFEKSMFVWVQTQEFAADDTGNGDQLGSFAAISDSHLIAFATISSDWNTGAAYDFRRVGSTWLQAGKLFSDDAAPDDAFGLALAISGETVLVGALGVDDACINNPNCDSGAAYVFQLAPTATQYGHCPSGAPCNNTDVHGGCRNSAGQGAILTACGSGSVITDDLQLEVTRCPPNKTTLLFMGGTQVQAPYADGKRVVGGGVPGVFRYGIVQSDALGMSMRGPGLVLASQSFRPPGRIQPGQVWNYQMWYRDPPGPCGGLTNFSNGVQVVFTP